MVKYDPWYKESQTQIHERAKLRMKNLFEVKWDSVANPSNTLASKLYLLYFPTNMHMSGQTIEIYGQAYEIVILRLLWILRWYFDEANFYSFLLFVFLYL